MAIQDDFTKYGINLLKAGNRYFLTEKGGFGQQGGFREVQDPNYFLNQGIQTQDVDINKLDIELKNRGISNTSKGNIGAGGVIMGAGGGDLLSGYRSNEQIQTNQANVQASSNALNSFLAAHRNDPNPINVPSNLLQPGSQAMIVGGGYDFTPANNPIKAILPPGSNIGERNQANQNATSQTPITSSGGQSPAQLTQQIQQSGGAQTQSFSLTAGNLQQGTYNNENVRQLQTLLGITADGDYGPQTKAAVMAFQRSAGIRVDGIVGEQTVRALNAQLGASTSSVAPSGGPSPVVGTSGVARTQEQENQAKMDALKAELDAGKQPKLEDFLSAEDKARLATAQTEATTAQTELENVANEKIALNDEFSKFKQQQAKEVSEGGRIGAITEEQRNYEFRKNVLDRREFIAETKLSNRKNIISEILKTQKGNYNDAVDQYNTNFTQSMQMYKLLNEGQDELHDNARISADTLIKSIKDFPSAFTNPDANSLRKWNEIEMQAGLPEGYIQSIAQSANKLGGDYKYKTTIGSAKTGYSALFVDDQGNLKVKKIAGETTPTTANFTKTEQKKYEAYTGEIAGYSDKQSALSDLQANKFAIVKDIGQKGYDKLLNDVNNTFKTSAPASAPVVPLSKGKRRGIDIIRQEGFKSYTSALGNFLFGKG